MVLAILTSLLLLQETHLRPFWVALLQLQHNQLLITLTKLATTAYVDAATGGGAGANVNLSNLSAVAINASLIAGADGTLDLGSAADRWRNALVETIQTGTSGAQTTLLQAYNTNTTSYTTFATLTANNPPTMSLASAVTGTTQSALDNSTKLATTAYVDAATWRWRRR